MPIPKQTLPPIDGNRKLLRDEAYEKILNAITDGKLSPGEKLHDETLQEWLGISRTPIRQAVARLVDLGVIEMSPNRYTRVALIDSKKFEEGVEVALVLIKRTVIDVVPNLDQADIEKYKKIVKKVKKICSEENADDEENLQATRQLTEFFNENSPNKRLVEVLNEIRAKFSIPKIISSHISNEYFLLAADQLLAGCENKNPQQVYEVIEKIYKTVVTQFLSSFDSHNKKF